MQRISEYLKADTLDELREAFSSVAGAEVGIVDSAPAEASPGEVRRPVMLDGAEIGWVVARPAQALGPAQEGWLASLMRLAADMAARMCAQEEELRTRIAELTTIYRLSAEFTARRDLQDILDTVAATVVDALKAKACSIRLLNEDNTELVRKAVTNLSPQYLDKGPILLSESRIDREVLSTGEPVYVADERTDERVLYPQEARREGIVSALCAPMIYKGRTEGVLRVYTDKPHVFEWFEVSLIKTIAAGAASAIVNARLYEEAVVSATMKRHLEMAGDVQRRMIPAEPPKLGPFDIGAAYVPTYELSGDFYDFLPLPGENLGLAVCDVVGKGVRASLLMASIRASLRAHAANVYDMSTVVGRVNRDLCADTGSSDFATLFYGVLNAPQKRLTYTNAGHVPPLLIRNGECQELTSGGTMIGIDPDARWEHEWVTLRAGDVILAFTDGLYEAVNFNDEPFGRDRVLQAALRAIEQAYDARRITQHVLWEMRRFAGLQKRFDDITIVALKVS